LVNKNRSGITKAAYLFAIFCAVLMITLNARFPMLEEVETTVIDDETGEIKHERRWQVVWEGGLTDLAMADESDPGAGNSGILEIYVYPHDGSPAVTYATNNSATLRSNAYAHYDADGEGPGSAGYTPHTVYWDLVIRVRANQTHAHDGSTFREDYIRCRVSTDAVMGSLSDVEFTWAEGQNVSTNEFMWGQFWGQDSGGDAGTGFDLERDETAEVTNIKFEAYY